MVDMADRRLSTLADERADEFDATICHNHVHEPVAGHHDHGPDLRRYLDVTEEVYQLADDLEGSENPDRRFDAFDAAEVLNGHVGDMDDEVVAAALAHLLEGVDDWDDIWEDDEIEAAKHEAREWLQDHHEVTERAGVWGEVSA